MMNRISFGERLTTGETISGYQCRCSIIGVIVGVILDLGGSVVD